MINRTISALLITFTAAFAGCHNPKFSSHEIPDPEIPNAGTSSGSGGTAQAGTGGTTSNPPPEMNEDPVGCTKDSDCALGRICNVDDRCEGVAISSGGTGNTGTGGSANVDPGGCTKDSDCALGRICNNDTRRCEGTPTGNGTGGTSSASGGTGNTGTGGSSSGSGGTVSGSGGTSGSGGSSGSGGTGNTGSGTTRTYTVSIILDTPASNFKFTHLSPDTDLFFPGQDCVGNSGNRECELTVDASLPWLFYVSTGVSGAGSWLPGKDGSTNRCTAYSDVEIWYVNKDEEIVPVPFSMVTMEDGCNFRIEPDAKLPNVATDDRDGDGTKTVDDCDDTNPSVLTCGGTGGSSGSNIRTVKFTTWGGNMSTGLFEITVVASGRTGETVCRSESAYDPDNPSTFGQAAVCYATFDRSKEAHFVTRVGNQWPSGYSAPGATNCVSNSLRVFVDDDGKYPYGRYPSGSVTSYSRVLADRYISQSDGCHIVLPAM